MLPISLEVKAICNTIVGPFCLVIYIVIMVYHFSSTYKHSSAFSNADNGSYPASLKYSFVMILVGFYCVLSLNLILIDSISTWSFCNVMLWTGPSSYAIFKLFMYMVLTARAKEFFTGSTFAYSARKLRIWNAILILWGTINTVGAALLSTTVLTDNARPRCSAVLYAPAAISMVLLDAVGGFGSSYLLVKPMLKMAKMEKEQNIETNSVSIRARTTSATKCTGENVKAVAMDFSSKFKSIARKQSTLSIISVITSWIALIMMILTNMHASFGSIDTVVSAICILLIYTWNQWIFDKLCIRCRKQTEATENVENLEVVCQGDFTDKNTKMERINSASDETKENKSAKDADSRSVVDMNISTGTNTAVIH